MANTWLTVGAGYNFAFAAFHILFWRIFRWRQDLASLTPANRAIMQVMNLRLIYVFLFFAAISLGFQQELVSTSFGRFVTAAIATFWFLRAIEQITFFRRTTASIVFFFIFLIGAGIYALALT